MDLIAYDSVGLGNPGTQVNQFVQGSETNLVTLIICIELVVIRSLICNELDRISLLRAKIVLTQLLGSLGDLNQNLMGGFHSLAACSDNWNQSMSNYLTGHDDRLSK